MQTKAFLLEEAVAGLAVQQRVEPFVFAEIAVGIIGLDRSIAKRVCVVQLLQSRVRNTCCGKSRTDRFQFGHNLEHLDQFDRSGLAHKHAASGQLLDKAGLRKSL